MNIVDRIALIESLCDSLKKEVVDSAKYMPLSWEGAELREYIKYKATLRTFKMDRERKRAFNNAIQTIGRL